MPSVVERGPNSAWIEALSPWPEEFGLDRMRGLLRELGDPQQRFRSVHVVGTNGKSTTTRTIEAALLREGLRAGCYVSPHVASLGERIRVDGEEADFEEAIGRIRAAAEALGATQFEVLTAAAFTAFAEAGVEAAAVEAGLGGRLDATNVIAAPVVVLTNVSLDHIEQLGSTRDAIAREKLAVIHGLATVVLGEAEWVPLAREAGAGKVVVVESGDPAELAQAAVSALLGRPIGAIETARLPGRLEQRGEDPLEIWDGAHNPAGVRYLLARLPRRRWVVVASMVADKETGTMLEALGSAGGHFVATTSSSRRALPAAELARLAAPFFEAVEVVEEPTEAARRGRELAGPAGAVLLTGSLYLLADLYACANAYDGKVR
jgi:dihydrofolate synthase/folylpolyglutamate synthase